MSVSAKGRWLGCANFLKVFNLHPDIYHMHSQPAREKPFINAAQPCLPRGWGLARLTPPLPARGRGAAVVGGVVHVLLRTFWTVDDVARSRRIVFLVAVEVS